MPDMQNTHYGPHERNVFDFYAATLTARPASFEPARPPIAVARRLGRSRTTWPVAWRANIICNIICLAAKLLTGADPDEAY